jgi:predicted nucleotidyltransferase
MPELHLTPAQCELVSSLLRQHLPLGSRVRVFGSRATGLGLKPHSDLDLLIEAPNELPMSVIGDLREAMAESALPFSVDLLQARDASEGFLAKANQLGMIELLGTANTQTY